MFHEDGTMRKSCKPDLVKQFENEVSPVLSLSDFDPSLTTYIRDGMISPDLHFRDVLAFMCSNVFNCDFEIGLYKLTDCPTERVLLTNFLHFFSPSLTAKNPVLLCIS
jgi:hypothetical protein